MEQTTTKGTAEIISQFNDAFKLHDASILTGFWQVGCQKGFIFSQNNGRFRGENN